MNAQSLRFARTHEWVLVEGDTATLGISEFAVGQLTDIVHIELPQPGDTVSPGSPLGEVESVKAVSDIYSPLTGEVVEVNDALPGDLNLLTESAYSDGWIARIRLRNADELDALMSFEQYQKHCESA